MSNSAGALAVRADEGPGPAGGTLHFEILGPLRLWRDGVEVNAGPRQQCYLLALLLARPGRPISMSELIELIWGEDAPASAANVIHKYVGTLRRLMEPALPLRGTGSYLRRHGDGYLFAPSPGMLDLITFREFVSAARASLVLRHRDEALDRYVEALGLWRGPAGDTYAYGTPAMSIFIALDREFLDVCVSAAELAVSLGRPARVLRPLRLAASMAPLHEPVQAGLISALAAAGHQAEALEVFRTVRNRLVEDLGIEPGEALQAAHRQVLSQAPIAPATDGAGDREAQTFDRFPAAPLVRPAQLPPDLPTFVGRVDELATLHRLRDGLDDAERTGPLIVALDGMGGVGKSTLAAHFAHLVAGDFADGQLYLDLRGDQTDVESMSAGDALGSLLSSQGVHVSSVPETLAARAGIYRSLTARKRVLVLLDNARDSAQLRPLLPNSTESLVLVTSRKPLVELSALDGAHLLHLDPPDMTTARKLVRRRLDRAPNRPVAETPAPADILDEIIELCGRLPLALAILAGRLSARPHLSLANVAAELRDGTERLAAFSSGRGVRDPRAAFAWSYRQLSSEAARLFRLSSAAMASGISAAAFASLSETQPRVARAILRDLADAALLDEDDRGRFTSHVLVKAYAQELFLEEESASDREAATTRLLQHYLQSSYHAATALVPQSSMIAPPPAPATIVPERPTGYGEAMRWFDDHREVLPEAVRHAAEGNVATVPWQLALTMQPWLQRSGRFHDWQDVTRLALKSARDRGDRVGAAQAMRSLADSCYYFAAYDEALDLLSDAQEVFAEDGMLLEQGIVHATLHRINTELGRHESALEESDRALALYRAAGVEQGAIRALAARGHSLARLGAVDEALSCLQDALARSVQAEWRTDEADIRLALAECLGEMGRQHQAVRQLEQAVEAAVEAQNSTGVFQASILLCEAHLDLDDVPAACQEWRNACDAMHTMQNGGTRTMRDKVCDIGDRLHYVTEFPPRSQDTQR
ncbi:transcriptional regulator, SARP family protein [Micromonospora sp. ALFpr18c]|uniref:AfsR/SARP family transcriptional regulator n=1 Tax=unclassified Micromonospora TaxID=2617518 RepID=UPI00124B23FB|nr:BTAD domain-containing putative transcriptional regulator [Micromonospora sp. ALFpr18c]KAB1947698.1 transcriptional regulator, SARP family protein [Micromonospora sp. ALFpr18c]